MLIIDPRIDAGKLIVIKGCMHSGKTETAMGAIRRLKHTDWEVAVFGSPLNDRDGDTITSNGQLTHPATRIWAPEMPRLARDAHVVVVNEGNLFPEKRGVELLDATKKMQEEGKVVLVDMLDKTSRGGWFGVAGPLILRADDVITTKAYCQVVEPGTESRCMAPAQYSLRVVNRNELEFETPRIIYRSGDQVIDWCHLAPYYDPTIAVSRGKDQPMTKETPRDYTACCGKHFEVPRKEETALVLDAIRGGADTLKKLRGVCDYPDLEQIVFFLTDEGEEGVRPAEPERRARVVDERIIPFVYSPDIRHDTYWPNP